MSLSFNNRCRVLLTLILLLFPFSISAEEYNEMAARIRSQVWAEEHPAFGVHKIPAQYEHESAVIIAEYDRITLERRNRINPMFLFANAVNHGMIHTTLNRQLIHIGDAVALERYSEYDITTAKTGTGLFNDKTSKDVVLGVRIYKPDGTMKEVDADDFVKSATTENRETRLKLAIPGLEIGDNLDVFVMTETMIQSGDIPPFAITFDNADAPTLNVEVEMEVSEDLHTRVRTLNGCPKFDVVHDSKNDVYRLRASATDLPARNEPLWYDFLSDRPIALVYSTNPRLTHYGSNLSDDDGLLIEPFTEKEYQNICSFLVSRFNAKAIVYKSASFKQIKKDKTLSLKEKCDRLYLTSRHAIVNRDRLYTIHAAEDFAYRLNKLKVKPQYVIWTNNRNEPFDNLLYESDATLGVYVSEIDTYYFFSANTTIAPGEIPIADQGRKGIMSANGKTYQWITTPSSKASDNVLTRNIEATITPETDGFAIQHNIEATGSMKEDYNNFIPDVFADSTLFAQMGNIVDTLYSEYLLRAFYKNARQHNAKQIERIGEMRKDALKKYYNTSDYQLISTKIDNIGFDPKDPIFRMSNNLILRDGAVSRAGRNIVANIGRLVPYNFHFPKSLRKERISDIVYPNGARTLAFNIKFQIPTGMTIGETDLKAIETNITNQCGSVVRKAAISDNALTINISITYNNARETAENWPQVLELIDAQLAFQKAQITLRKNK